MSDDIPVPAQSFEPDASTGAGAGAENHAAAEGADATDMGRSSTLREMLLSTEPGKPLSAVESPYDPQRGGLTRMYRGVQKMTGADGTPAIVDLVLGAVEITVSQQSTDADGGDDLPDLSP